MASEDEVNLAGFVKSRTSPDLDKSAASSIQPLSPSRSVPANVRGEAHNRFVVVSTLLSLIDPVRGESTTHSLDKHPHDDFWRHDQLQKKFLDSFALISSTSRIGGDTASAVCLEQGHPSGTVLRLARNLGVPKDLAGKLQEVLDDLTAIALRGILPRTHDFIEYRMLIKSIYREDSQRLGV